MNELLDQKQIYVRTISTLVAVLPRNRKRHTYRCPSFLLSLLNKPYPQTTTKNRPRNNALLDLCSKPTPCKRRAQTDGDGKGSKS